MKTTFFNAKDAESQARRLERKGFKVVITTHLRDDLTCVWQLTPSHQPVPVDALRVYTINQ